MGMSLDYLLFLTDHYPRVCFGSSGEFWDVGSEAWCQRADKAFNSLAKRHRFIPHIHMLRGLALAGKRWPFASADSVNVARNFKDAKKCLSRWQGRLIVFRHRRRRSTTRTAGCSQKKMTKDEELREQNTNL